MYYLFSLCESGSRYRFWEKSKYGSKYNRRQEPDLGIVSRDSDSILKSVKQI